MTIVVFVVQESAHDVATNVLEQVQLTCSDHIHTVHQHNEVSETLDYSIINGSMSKYFCSINDCSMRFIMVTVGKQCSCEYYEE